MFKRFIILLLPLFILGGCAHRIGQRDLMSLFIGLSKQQVVKKIGKPNVFRGSMLNKFGQTIEVYEYEVKRGVDGKRLATGIGLVVLTFGLYIPLIPAFIEHKRDIYWLYFHDNKLAQWGQAGDWNKEADSIYEVRFR